jgi:hypothetical protein
VRHFLFGHEVVGAEDQPIGVADEELAAEVAVAGDGQVSTRLRQVALQVRVLVHEPIQRAAGDENGVSRSGGLQ